MWSAFANFFAHARQRPLAQRAAVMLAYGLLSFGVIWLVSQPMNSALLFRVFEALWFVHIVIIANQITSSQRELIVVAALGLLPGIINNLLLVMQLRGW